MCFFIIQGGINPDNKEPVGLFIFFGVVIAFCVVFPFVFKGGTLTLSEDEVEYLGLLGCKRIKREDISVRLLGNPKGEFAIHLLDTKDKRKKPIRIAMRFYTQEEQEYILDYLNQLSENK
jgi:hypothetical protein